MWDWIKKHHLALILGIGGLVFFCLFSYLNFTAPLRFNSPDETANFFFIRQYSEQGRLWAYESDNYYLDDRVHPRSIQIVDDFLVPGGFIGLPFLYGLLAKVITPGLTIYLTPLFAVLAGWAWFGIVRKYFNKWVGLISVYLLWTMPAWWYYSARGFLPNVLFVSLGMISAYFCLVRPLARHRAKKEMAKSFIFDNLDWLVGGVFLGASLMVRPSEVIWMAGVGALLLAFNFKKINWPGSIIFLAVAMISFTPMLVLNNSLYGNPLATGYQSMNDQIIIEDEDTANNESVAAKPENLEEVIETENLYWRAVKKILLPFGFVSGNIWRNFVNYHLEFQWWYTIGWLAGLIFMAVQTIRKKMSWTAIQFAIIFGFVSAWLIIVYGSWQFFDNINVGKITIGNSYLRYWLPSFVLATPIIADLIFHVGRALKFKSLKIIWMILFISFFGAMGAYTTYWGEDEGLAYVRRHLQRYEWIADRVLEITEPNAIIITDRSDKIFFPYRKIVYPLQSEATYSILKKMYFVAPIYYYGVALADEAVEYLNSGVFADNDLKMEKIESFDNEALYIFYLAQPSTAK